MFWPFFFLKLNKNRYILTRFYDYTINCQYQWWGQVWVKKLICIIEHLTGFWLKKIRLRRIAMPQFPLKRRLRRRNAHQTCWRSTRIRLKAGPWLKTELSWDFVPFAKRLLGIVVSPPVIIPNSSRSREILKQKPRKDVALPLEVFQKAWKGKVGGLGGHGCNRLLAGVA